MRERDEIDVHRIQDQLDGHQDNHDIAAGKHADGADYSSAALSAR